jgi:hypothetical protein
MAPRSFTAGGALLLSATARRLLPDCYHRWTHSDLGVLFRAGEMVGAAGFEPTTTSPPDWCATRLRHAPTGAESSTGSRPDLT